MEKRKTTIDGFAAMSRKVAGEGIVLIKNERETLPVRQEETVAVFGRCQINYYRSGTGSGGSVNVPYMVSALEGFRASEGLKIDETLASVYEAYVEENPFDNGGGGWAAEPWFQKEMTIEDTIAAQAAERSDKALVIIGRTAGEEQDNRDKEGSFRLTEAELDMLEVVTRHFDKVAVVLNVSNIIDMSWMDNHEQITSVLYAWHGGMEGGNALADVVTGKTVPSGKLTDTIASELTAYPSDRNFHKEDALFYQEDIYLGYRYFETFARDKVRYPFGYGLSYTTFDIKVDDIRIEGHGDKGTATFVMTVTNTGQTYSGKEVVQLYVEAPQGKLGKPARELIGFIKTELLAPGQSESLAIEVRIRDMASYDDNGITGHKSCYVLEEGVYSFYLGKDVRHAVKVESVYEQPELLVTEELQEVLAPVEVFERFRPGMVKEDGCYELNMEPVPLKTMDVAKVMKDNAPEAIPMTEDLGIKLTDVKEGRATLEAFIGQLPQHALETIVRGEGMCSPKVTPGTAGAFGGTGDVLLGFGIPVGCASDGPSGIRMDTGEEATQVPIGTLQACTWNSELIYELYVFEGKELCLNQVDTLLGPGMNIHRHPLNGRNFEYFSEDPYLTGVMATATVKGINDGGSQGTIKHFAANDQEHNRQSVNSIVSERALREIHLKGFEMAVKDGGAKSIMTAYNPINGIWTASNYELNTTVLRQEWGFTGIVMSDWWAKMNDPVTGGEPSMRNMASMVRAQNDIFMPVNNFGAEVNSFGDDLREAQDKGILSVGELQRSAMNICRFLLQSPSIERPVWKPKVIHFEPIGGPDNLTPMAVCQELELNTVKDMTFSLEVKEAGLYSIVTRMKHDNGPGAQSASNIMINGILATSANLNGTWGESVKEKSMSISLETGSYEVKLIFTKPGLEIETLNFVKQ